MFIQQQNNERDDYKVKSKVSPVAAVLRSKPTKGVTALLVFSIVVPVLVYYFLFDRGSFSDEGSNTCSVNKAYRIHCGKDENASFLYCSTINCCYDDAMKRCYHYLPSKYYYHGTSDTYDRSLAASPFQRPLSQNIALTINEIDENTLAITLHVPGADVTKNELTTKNYVTTVNKNPLYVEVSRADSNDLLLTTAKGPTIISDKYWEWSFQLTDEYLFGLGQLLIDLDENSNFTKVIYPNRDDHNTLPLFLAYKNGSYHGLRVRHSGPMEVTVIPSKAVSLKCLAGDRIGLELSVGPTPVDVWRQQRGQASAVDLWTLGVHLCREGSDSSLKDILNNYNSELNVQDPVVFRHESDCIHENLVMALWKEDKAKPDNFKRINDLITSLKDGGGRFVLSVPPQVPFNGSLYNDVDLGVFFKNETGYYTSKYLGTDVVYPHFYNPNITQFLGKLIDEIKSYLPGNFPTDFVLNHNWPSDDSFQMERINEFQYLSEDLLQAMSFTLPWNLTNQDQLQIVNHNDYGAWHLEKFQTLVQPEHVMTASRNFDTSQPVMVQNVDTSWTNFKKAMTTTLYNSMSGYTLTSVPVCGSTDNFNATNHESLCMRWYLMASTAPIFRISSDSPKRDPTSLAATASGTAAQLAVFAIELRYKLRQYYYTVLNQNQPLMRPMFYDFPDDEDTFGLDEQYMVGDGLLVAHPTLPDKTQQAIYFPKPVDVWYEFWGGEAFTIGSGTNDTRWLTISIVETDWIGFVREGFIIPTTEAVDADTNSVKLIVGLKCVLNGTCEASGSLMIESDLFTFTSTDVDLSIERSVGTPAATGIYELSELVIYQVGEVTRNLIPNQNIIEITDVWRYTYQ